MKWFLVHPDGSRYGPATADELHSWLAERRAKPESIVEDSVSGTQSTVGDVLGLAPEIEMPSLELETSSSSFFEPVPAPVAPTQPAPSAPHPGGKVVFHWDNEPAAAAWTSEIGEDDGLANPGPIDDARKKAASDVTELLGTLADPQSRQARAPKNTPPPQVVWPESPPVADKRKGKMSKAPRAPGYSPKSPTPDPFSSTAMSLNGKNLTMGAYVVSGIGVVMGCCIPLPLVGLFLAVKASKNQEKGALGALCFSGATLLLTLVFWISNAGK